MTTTLAAPPPDVEPQVVRLVWLQRVVLAAPAVVAAIVAWNHRLIADDGFIFLRVAQQIVAGHGPVFNTGQRVEAFSSPLWVLALAIADVVTPLRLEWIAVLLGIVATTGGFAFICFGSARLVRDPSRDDRLVPLGALVPLAVGPVWFYATSGMETGLVFLWLGASLWILATWAQRDERISGWAAVVLGIGWLVRPDLLVASMAFAVVLLAVTWRADRWRDRGRVASLMFALPVLYQIFRMGYYGAIVANPAIAKEASLSRWSTGWSYVLDFAGTYWILIPLLALVAGAYVPLMRSWHRAGSPRSRAVGAAFFIAAVLQTVYVVRVGGDYFHARLLLPALFTFCAPVAVVPCRRAYVVAFAIVPWAVVCGVIVRPTGGLASGSVTLPITAAARGWGPGGTARDWYDGPGVYYSFNRLAVTPAKNLHLPTDALWGIGLPSYGFGPDFDVLDMLGLADPLTARLQLERRGFPGHEKQLPGPWAAARLSAPGSRLRAADFPPAPLLTPMIPQTKGRTFDEQVAWARAALACPVLVDLRRSTEAPMSPGRFFSNLVDSFSSTRLRIPADPEQAYRKFCGPGRPAGT